MNLKDYKNATNLKYANPVPSRKRNFSEGQTTKTNDLSFNNMVMKSKL